MSLKIWLPLNGNIENQGTLNTTSRLPSGYTEVEYLESTGAQYIDTGVDNNTNSIKLYTTIQVTVPASTNAYALGYYTDNQGQFFLYRNGTVWQWGWRCGYLNSTGAFDTNKHSHIFYVENNIAYYKLDGQIVSQHSADRAGGRIYIAGNKHNQSTVRTFTAAIDDGNTVKRNFIPCYRNSDNKPGMYDTVTGTFYTNAGSGEFSVGPAVTCSITNNGATFVDGGKIGQKCVSNGTITINNNYIAPILNSMQFTMAVWIKCSTVPNNYHLTKCGLMSVAKSADLVLGLDNGVTGSFFGNDCTSANEFDSSQLNKWKHIVWVSSGSKHSIYIDGILKQTINCPASLSIPNGSSLSILPDNTVYVSDFRLYDECLSADQIKEISRGMVLHYKMCGNIQIPNNCYSNPTFDTSNSDGGWGHWTGSGGSGSFSQNTDKNFIFRSGQTYSHKVTCNSSATWDYSCYQEPEFSGGYRSLCAIIKASDSARITENICYPTWNARNGGVENKKWTSVNKLRDGFYLCKCEGIKQDGSNDLVGIYVKPGKTIYISECYLENGYEKCSDFWTRTDIEYDGSGFKNHGTVSGNVTLSADSPRYTGSYKFGTNNYITTTSTGNYIKSATFWAKDDGSVPSDGLVFRDQNSGLAFGIQSGNLITGAIGGPAGSSSASISVSNAKYTANTWHFFACVNDNGTQRLYMDGIQISTGTGTGNWSQGSPTNSLNIGGRAGSSYWPGYISDFKMYATVLSATDIQELYKLGRN